MAILYIKLDMATKFIVLVLDFKKVRQAIIAYYSLESTCYLLV